MILTTKARIATLFATATVALLPACDFDSELAPRVALDVVVDGDGVTTHTNDLGYIVDLSRCRVAIDTVEFTTDGEMLARAQRTVLDSLVDLAIPTAYAHPGHAAGGEVVGELPGRFVFDWRADGQVLGEATMVATQYSGANFTFARASKDEGILPDDPILGHTFDIAGEATFEGQTVTFEVQLDQDEDRRVVGLPLDLYVDDDSDEVLGAVTSPPRPLRGRYGFRRDRLPRTRRRREMATWCSNRAPRPTTGCVATFKSTTTTRSRSSKSKCTSTRKTAPRWR